MKIASVFKATAVCCAVALIVPGAFAQSYGGAAGLYNPATVRTITGTVIRVSQISSAGGPIQGIQIVLQTDLGQVIAVISPYTGNQGFQIQTNDHGVSVTGSLISLDGTSVIIAAEVRNGNQLLRLRDTGSGVPVY